MNDEPNLQVKPGWQHPPASWLGPQTERFAQGSPQPGPVGPHVAPARIMYWQSDSTYSMGLACCPDWAGSSIRGTALDISGQCPQSGHLTACIKWCVLRLGCLGDNRRARVLLLCADRQRSLIGQLIGLFCSRLSERHQCLLPHRCRQ